jgi:glycosyltransferase involved in cell wall biosynthesis
MNVLFITTAFPSEESPAAGVFVLEHARAVAPHADVAVLHLDRRHGVRGITVRRDERAEFPTWRVSYPYRPTAFSVIAHAAAGIAGYRAVRREGFVPDVLHAHFFLAALPGALIAKATGKPLVETEQWTIFLPEDPARLTLPLRLGARASLAAARVVMPVSHSLEQAMAKAGVQGPFRVVPNAVDTSQFHPGGGGGGTRLVTVSMINPQKGVDVLLRAVARVRETRRDVTLDIVGDGPDRLSAERLARELGLDGAVTFHGLLLKPAIADILARSDLFVLASRFDNNPCVLVEAQAAGLPIVSTRVGGIPELVDGHGALVERDDLTGLADAISSTLARLGEFDRDAIAATASERYSFDAVGRAFADVYRSVTTG